MATKKVNGEVVRGKIGGARYAWPVVQDTYQKHAIKLLDPLETVGGEVLPAGTCASILSGGNYGLRMSCCLSLWGGGGRQVHVYT
jgi:hypothetical protein